MKKVVSQVSGFLLFLVLVFAAGLVAEEKRPQGEGMRPPPREVIEKIEAAIKEWAKKEGLETTSDEQGRLVGKDKTGKIVRPPLEVIAKVRGGGAGRGGPSREEIEKAEAAIKEWATKNGYTTEKAERGPIIVKDKSGKEVRIPQELLPKFPGQKPHATPEEIAKIEAAVKEWATRNGYTTVRDERGRLVAKDQAGNIVRPPPEVIRRSPKGQEGRRGHGAPGQGSQRPGLPSQESW